MLKRFIASQIKEGLPTVQIASQCGFFFYQNGGNIYKGPRSRYFRKFCLILVIMSSKRQIGRPRVFHLHTHGYITTENDFRAV